MKRKTMMGLVAVAVIVSVAIFAICVEKKTPKLTPTSTPTQTISPLPTLTPTLTPSPTPTPLPTPILTPTPAPPTLLEIETPNWNFDDTEAMRLHREGKDNEIIVSEITSHAPPPFYKGEVPFTYEVGYEEIAPFAMIVVYHDFYKGFRNYFIYEYGNNTLFPVPDGVITLDASGNKLAEARAIRRAVGTVTYGTVTYENTSFLEIEEFHYKNARLAFHCKSVIWNGIKILEKECIGKKDEEYYFMYPDRVYP